MRRALPFLFTSFLVAPAFAQDSDGDGVADNVDAFPCDASLASVLYAPSEAGFTMLAFEDQWPASTDLDYNDVVVRAHYRFHRHAGGGVRQILLTIDPVALGGIYDNGLALQLPASRTGVIVQRRAGNGAWTPLALEPDANVTVVLSPNLRELFGGAAGPINSRNDLGALTAQRLEVQLDFPAPVSLNTGLAPFDLFVFRTGNLGHQIHLPAYSGTAAMNTALFNSGVDSSVPGRSFLHVNGTPFALNLQGTARYPLEGVGIDLLFPNIVTFASSGGAQQQDFYQSNVVAAEGRLASASAAPAALSADRSCLPASVTLSTLNYNGMSFYPLNLNQCTPTIGACCAPTTTQQQMDAFCRLAGRTTATTWVVQTLPSTSCYCWGGCTNNAWYWPCCSGSANRNFVTQVTCQ